MTAPASEMAASEVAAPWDAASCMAAPWMAASDPRYFADFEQVKIFSSHLDDFEQVKKTSNKTPVGETGSLCIFFWPWSHVTGTPPWLLRPVKVSTSSELYPNTWLFFVFECIGIQFFNSLTCDLWDAMPCHWSQCASQPPCHPSLSRGLSQGF